MQIFQDHDYDRNVAHHYRETLKFLVTRAVIHDQRETVVFIGDMLKSLMTEAEQESFRAVLKSAKGAAKVDAERAEAIVQRNLADVLSHVPPKGWDKADTSTEDTDPTGGATVTNPEPPNPIRPNDGAAVVLPRAKRPDVVTLDAGITF